MVLTPRRRALLAVLAGGVAGYAYLVIVIHLVANLARESQPDAYVPCSSGAFHSLDAFNGCNSNGALHSGYVWLELLVLTVLLLAVAYGVARWVVAPLRQMADTIARFGPNSLGVRLRAAGPHDETRELARAVDTVLDRLAAGYDAQRRFAANASHELRTPLATQRALIEVSLTERLTDEQLALLSRQLLATNERNERLVDGLLTLAETDGGLMTTAPLRLDEIVGECVEALRATADQQQVDVAASLAPAVVVGERPLLERLVHNLVGNAIKYNHPGGRVTVDVAADGTLAVVNTGPDLAAEQMAGLFEPFRRGSGERLQHGDGVGLGLTIARSIAVAHGAGIDARPNPGGGLIVTVRLPLA